MTIKRERLHYGWVMVLIALSVLATHALVMYTFGVFLKPLVTEFNWDRGALSGANSMYMLLAGTFAIFTGRLSDKYGPRMLVTLNGLLTGIGFLALSQINSLWQVYLIWGLFLGIGGSCCFIPIMSTIPRWFVKKTGIAIGITVAGFGLGAVITPPLTQWLISAYGWRQAFIVLGLITFVIVIPLAQFMKHSPQRVGLKPYGEIGTLKDKQSQAAGGLSFRQAIKTSRFLVWGSIICCFFFSVQVIVVHIVPHGIDIGISATVAAGILSIIAGGSVIGRLSMGFIYDRIGSRKALSACLTLVALALIWLLFAKEIWGLYIFAGVLGLAYGGVVLLETALTGELFGLKSLGMILGGVILFGTVGGALGAPLAGSIFDATGSYSLALLICVILVVLAIILSLILLKTKGWRSTN
jgi:MFS family permease